jgi:high-affinity iron transporter
VGSGFLIMLREGLEAALIVAIVLAYLKRLGREANFRPVLGGTLAAVAVSLLTGTIIFALVGGLHGRVEQITEGVIALSSAAVLTWMIFWMGRQARHIKGNLQSKVDAALATNSGRALAILAFVAVVREGIESSLFLLSTGVGEKSNAAQLVGGLIGVVCAAGIGYLVYRGSHKVNLRVFFRVTGIMIILFAAGLVAKGVLEFQEASLFGSVNQHAWNLSSLGWLNPDASQSGEFLKGLFGWNPAPSIESIASYLLYLIPIGGAFLMQTRKVPRMTLSPARTAEANVPAA